MKSHGSWFVTDGKTQGMDGVLCGEAQDLQWSQC